jgi:hypothetical protein
VDLVAINPQTSREACLKTFNMVHMIDDKRLVKVVVKFITRMQILYKSNYPPEKNNRLSFFYFNYVEINFYIALRPVPML